MENIVITIARQYGSGGKTVGQMVAKELGISKSTVQRRFNSLVSNDVKIQNLNVNDNVNIDNDATNFDTNFGTNEPHEPKTGIDRINSLI